MIWGSVDRYLCTMVSRDGWIVSRGSVAHFSSNSKNTNSIKLGKSTFDNKNLNGTIKYASSFLIKMEKYVAEDSVPTDVPSFARGIIESIKPAEKASAKTSASSGAASSGAAKPGQDELDKKRRRKLLVRRTLNSPSLASQWRRRTSSSANA